MHGYKKGNSLVLGGWGENIVKLAKLIVYNQAHLEPLKYHAFLKFIC